MAAMMIINSSVATMTVNDSVATMVANNSATPMAVGTSTAPMAALPINISLTIIGFAIAVANGTVFLVFFSNRSLRTLTNYFVMSLAICDFFVGTILLPIQVWSPMSEALGPLIAFMLFGSLSNICGCTYDRYIAVQDPLRYHAILTPSKVHKVILWIWAVPLVIALIPQIWLHLTETETTEYIQRIYIGFLSFGVLLACVVLAWIYVGIFRVAKRHVDAISCLEDFAQGQRRGTKSGMKRRNSIKSFVKHVKAAKLAAIIGIAFLLCWLPLIIINIFESLNKPTPEDFVTAALFTLFANSLINPLIYAFFQKDFRLTLFKLIRKKFSKRENSEFQSSAKNSESCALFGPNLDKSAATFNEDEIKNDDNRKRNEACKRPSTVSFHLPGPETSRL